MLWRTFVKVTENTRMWFHFRLVTDIETNKKIRLSDFLAVLQEQPLGISSFRILILLNDYTKLYLRELSLGLYRLIALF